MLASARRILFIVTSISLLALLVALTQLTKPHPVGDSLVQLTCFLGLPLVGLLYLVIIWVSSRTGRFLLACLCVLLSFACFINVGRQLDTVGFASGNREPDHFASYLALSAGVIGLSNMILIISSTSVRRPYTGFVLTAGLLLASIHLVFTSWF